MDHKITFVLLLLQFFLIAEVRSQTSLIVLSDTANIYITPDVNSSLSITAQKGDTFEIEKNQNDEWVQIHMFTGANRYIKKSAIEVVQEVSPYPSNPSISSKLCEKIKILKHKASEKSKRKYVNNVLQQATYKKLLIDKYVLTIFRDFGISASHYSKLIECVDDKLGF